MERWRAVVGFEGLYEVSDQGRVRGIGRGKVLAVWVSKEGYHRIPLWRNSQRKVRMVSSLVLEAFVGPRPDGWEACHGDGNSLNDRLGNLRWGTKQENEADKLGHGTRHKGETMPAAKLKEADIAEIRALAGKVKQKDLVARFGVSQAVISQVQLGKAWRHI